VVAAVSETQFIHFLNHFKGASCRFRLSLWQKHKMGNLGASESIAEALGQAATQAPQPMHAAASMASSAICAGTGMLFASGA